MRLRWPTMSGVEPTESYGPGDWKTVAWILGAIIVGFIILATSGPT